MWNQFVFNPRSLLQIDDAALSNTSSTISLLRRLFDNYVLDVHTIESTSDEQAQEELDFLNAILKTSMMKHTMRFLQQKGKNYTHTPTRLVVFTKLDFIYVIYYNFQVVFPPNTMHNFNCLKAYGLHSIHAQKDAWVVQVLSMFSLQNYVKRAFWVYTIGFIFTNRKCRAIWIIKVSSKR